MTPGDSNEELAHACRQRGLQSMLEELRDFEQSQQESASLSVKKADGASAFVWLADPA